MRDSDNVLKNCKPLTRDDVDLLAVRFELQDSIHVGLFLQYFDELTRLQNYYSINRGLGLKADRAVDASISPFRVSSEWQQLRSQSIMAQEKSLTKKIIRKSLQPPPIANNASVPIASASSASVPITPNASLPISPNATPAADEAKVEEKKHEELPTQAEAKKDSPLLTDPAAPPKKASFADFFRCGSGRKAPATNAPREAPAAIPHAESKDDEKSSEDEKPQHRIGDEKGSKGGSDEGSEGSEKKIPLSSASLAPPSSSYNNRNSLMQIDTNMDGQPPLKRDDHFDTPPKTLPAESKKPTFSRPKQPQHSQLSDDVSDNASQASERSRRSNQSQQQQKRNNSSNGSRFRKVPQKGFEVEELDDNFGSHYPFHNSDDNKDNDAHNESFYRRQQRLQEQDNVMQHQKQRKHMDDKDSNRSVNFSPSTRGQ